MRSGRTVAGEREKAVSDSERQRVRKATKGRKIRGILFVLIACAAITFLTYLGVKSWLESYEMDTGELAKEEDYTLDGVSVIDENGVEVTVRIKKYIWQISGDLADLGYRLEKVVLPVGKIKEIDLYIAEFPGYIKVNSDRETAVSAEDIDRMVRYLSEHEIEEITYIDVRIAEKAYYK